MGNNYAFTCVSLICVCHTLVPEICVHPKYSVHWSCIINNCQDKEPFFVCREDCRWRQVGKCTDTCYIQIETVGAVVVQQNATMSVWNNGMGWLYRAVLLVWHRCDTELITVTHCALADGCWAADYNAEASLALLAYIIYKSYDSSTIELLSQYNQFRLTPTIFLIECTSSVTIYSANKLICI